MVILVSIVEFSDSSLTNDTQYECLFISFMSTFLFEYYELLAFNRLKLFNLAIFFLFCVHISEISQGEAI